MKIKKICECCNTEYSIPHWRKEKSKFCSKKCSVDSKKAKAETECTHCKKLFHVKKSQKEKNKIGNFCSTACFYEFKKDYFKGINNHQYGLKGHLNSSFKGLEIKRKNNKLIDIHIYMPEHPYANKNGRILKHRFLVEENYEMFDISKFVNINNKWYLHKDLEIHHKDGNHDNNDIANLQIVTKSEHRSIHNFEREIIRDNKTGRISGVLKQGELSGKPIEGNQQPSLSSNTLEGSTTNSRVQTGDAEDSNADTSALQFKTITLKDGTRVHYVPFDF
jgi:hypothetical protein